MKNKTIAILTIAGALILILGIASYGSLKKDALAGDQLQSREQKSYQQKQSADKVQVFVFHATQRCIFLHHDRQIRQRDG